MGLSLFSSLSSFLVDCFFPLQCLFCKKEGALCCSECLSKIGYTESRCPFCNAATEDFRTCTACKRIKTLSGAITFFNYDDPKVKKIIAALKFRGWFSIIHSLQSTFIERLSSSEFSSSSTMCLPAPQRLESFLSRGYNQSSMLCSSISALLDIPHVDLLRINSAKAQHTKTKELRWQTTSHITIKHQLAESIKNAIVVDDLLTTGATLEGCARALRNAGVQHVFGIALARQYKHKQ